MLIGDRGVLATSGTQGIYFAPQAQILIFPVRADAIHPPSSFSSSHVETSPGKDSGILSVKVLRLLLNSKVEGSSSRHGGQ